jgi:hypothetical protein
MGLPGFRSEGEFTYLRYVYKIQELIFNRQLEPKLFKLKVIRTIGNNSGAVG